MFNSMGLINDTTGIHTNVSCSCNCKHTTSFQSTEISQLEFVQILVIVVVMMVMVVVITCLLNHYRLSAYSLLTRHSAARRQHLPFTSDTSLWPSDGVGPSSGASEQQVSGSRPPDPVGSRGGGAGGGVGVAAGRFQPTWPYLQHSIIELPPTISLSDGEEPPPYQGPCTLQLRDPEQQLELNRESVRAPPNRTIYDGPLIGPPCPPSTYSSSSSAGSGSGSGSISISVGGYPNQPRQEGAPPTYSEAVGHYYHPSPPRHLRTGGGNPTPLIQAVENRNARNKEKQKGQQV
ncbi:protein TMEPAI isoform X1 [Alosa sapidissima]|uniref:protein TMEPAI isoform X1 n=1 Tax=Alosa sapidissima TaxID=34773 RepID=UPI001C09CF46|nr:protein TMEPAI isoform X1 [Alosa sapidissima]